MKLNRKIKELCFLTLLLIPGIASASFTERTFCVWDPIGANGPFSTLMEEMKVKVLKWDVKLKIRAYTDETIASNDFKAGQCDAVAVTEMSSRDYNTFTGSIGAVGALPTLKDLNMMLKVLAQPKAAKHMVEGDFEVGGILPVGPIYTFVTDRSIDTFDKFKGKKMATFDVDPVQVIMAQQAGATPVGSSLSRFSGQFNNGAVDIAFAPATAYLPLELYKGVEAGGGVIKRPLLQATLQIIIRHEKFPEGFGQNTRTLFASMSGEAIEFIKKVEQDIPQEHWIHVDTEATNAMDDVFRASRISLRDKGLYNPKTLTLMRKVRCKHNPGNVECTEKTE